MFCRALVTAVVISYLICVLWLSGLQKNDLDVNILRKLQLHNVNIDEMNNESFHQECLQLQLFKNYETRNISNSSGNWENKTKAVITHIKSKSNVNEIVLSQLDTISKEMTNNLIILSENGTNITENKQTEMPTNMNLDHKQNLDEIQQFWQIFKTTSPPQNLTSVTTEETDSSTVKVDKKYELRQPENNNKLYNKMQKLTTSVPTNTRSDNIHNMFSQQIEELLDVISKSDNIILKNENVNPDFNNFTKTRDLRLSDNVIKQIAENVKAIILKDIRHDAITTESSAVPVITMTPSAELNTTIQYEEIKNAQQTTTEYAAQVMEKIINLFEEIKTVKEKTVLTGQMKLNISEKRTIQPELKPPLKFFNHAPVLLLGSKVKEALRDQPHSPLGIQIVPDTQHKIVKPLISSNVKNKHVSHTQQKPITIQTNSGEIRPLGIALSKPLNLIHQNIIVTPMHPAKIQSEALKSPTGTNFNDANQMNIGMSQKYNAFVPISGPFKRDRAIDQSNRILPKSQEQSIYTKNKNSWLENQASKLSAPYRSERITNTEINYRAPQFEDEQSIYLRQTRFGSYKTARNRVQADTHSPFIFEDERPRFQEQERGNLHSLFNEDNLKSLQERSYKNSNTGNQYTGYSPRLDYGIPRSKFNKDGEQHLDNVKQRSSEQNRYQPVRIVNEDDYRPFRFNNDKPQRLVKNEKESHPYLYEEERQKQNNEDRRIRNYENQRLRDDILQVDKVETSKVRAYDDENKYSGDKRQNRERFHEMLERADSAEQTGHFREGKGEKTSMIDDTHFNEFMKTQQRVNEMLEKILATKTVSRIGPPSVESI